MMRQTGGRSAGATSTRSNSAAQACRNRLVGRKDAQLRPVGADDADGSNADLFVDSLFACRLRRPPFSHKQCTSKDLERD